MDLDSNFWKTLCDPYRIESCKGRYPNIPMEMITALVLLAISHQKYGLPSQELLQTLHEECVSFNLARDFWRTKGKG